MAMEDYFNFNIKLLKESKNNGYLAKYIIDRGIADVKFIDAKDGNITAEYKGILLHSKYFPLKESEKFAGSCGIVPDKDVIIYGFGLGYHIEAILKMIKNVKVIVLEGNIEILKTAFFSRDLSGILSDPRIYIVGGFEEEDIALKFSYLVNKELDMNSGINKVVIHNASYKLMPAEFADLKKSFEIISVGNETKDVFYEKNRENFLKNIDYLVVSPGISKFAGKFKNKSAFFINAGPSLDETLEIVKKYGDAAYLFSVDTAVPPLMDFGIEPDFILSVDPQDKSYGHFEGYDFKKAALIFIPTSNWKVVDTTFALKIVALQKGHSVTSTMEKLLESKGMVTTGNSVSCMGLEILNLFGFSNVFFFGMDYAFSFGKVYSAHSRESREWFVFASSFLRPEMRHRDSVNSADTFTVKDKTGEYTKVYKNLHAYLRYVESYIENAGDVSYYNVFSKGAAIKGVDDIVLEEEIGRLICRSKEYGFKDIFFEYDSSLKDKITEIFYAAN